MRIIRFLDSDGVVRRGARTTQGDARPLRDPLGIMGLGPDHDPRAARPWYQGRRVVVADDDEGMRDVLAAVFDSLGCRCEVCADGDETVAAIERELPDVVVTDIAMPGRTGIEIFDAARSQHPTLPVLLVTGFGYDPTHTLVRVAELGHDHILYKPFTPLALIDATNRAARDSLRRPLDGLLVMSERVTVERLLAPIRPAEIVCIGHNYHRTGRGATGPAATAEAEAGRAEARGSTSRRLASGASASLEVFLKPASAVSDPGEPVRLPAFDDIDPKVDCEGELAVVIGRRVQGVTPDHALDHVLGYTIAGDVTARHWQSLTGPPLWMRGKGFDTFCPLGPEIVTTDELPDVSDLRITTAINGETVRAGRTSDLVRGVPELIAELSQHLTLEPGTVILTGAPPILDPETPSLESGDTIAIEIEGLGRLETVVDG